MHLTASFHQVFDQLKYLITHVSAAVYAQPVPALSGSTMGEHVRHILEMLQALTDGYPQSSVNYEGRARRRQLEQDPQAAALLADQLLQALPEENKTLQILSEPAGSSNLSSNYFRELAYVLEHTIHHMALLRVCTWHHGGPKLPDSFGVAFSTIKYRERCAQ